MTPGDTRLDLEVTALETDLGVKHFSTHSKTSKQSKQDPGVSEEII